ncbi:ArsR family transcriptional regulator [Allorhizobium ampelinum]|uniref:Metalloregulator ArsR/SmtB family transcription factor n=2 Tax=Rhizobiaceae TaxID=82115 RepID=A0AAE4WJM6_AGRVI|nr:helix-turn-helix transcriptional regulator [Allorhizobium ampelinum]MCF1498091.1 helix-turn-helix transcriptional regulator [Allorhizobium sp. Av2]MCM2440216.1 helix-turn-helix transcriptional regulator [Agrobacterium vitis]MCF1461454.1 helix-turn-helix transcriptional regulator [Allorhizobium ampelinum]MCF1473866.1 helix-turn-helix transcriptional regulator [Allorhizobium ampelinum]
MIASSTDAETPASQLANFMQKAAGAAALLKALSHENRLLILCILSEGEKTVGELEVLLQLQQAIVSQQLARLRMDNLVESRRSGRQIYYSITNPAVKELVSVLYQMYCSPAGEETTFDLRD